MLDITKIQEKKAKLLEVSIKLKKDFVGLDTVIDRLIQSIEVWYIFPELLVRPLVVNLWGMTGVGKTDLVRKLVAYLEFKDSYVEIQFKTNSSNYDTIQGSINSASIDSNKQSILLLDEIQRFATVDEQGKLIRGQSGYADVWELLSDGSFSNAFEEKRELEEELTNLLYQKDESESNTSTPEAVEGSSDNKQNNRKYKMYIWRASGLKKLLDSPLTTEEIMQLTNGELIRMIQEKIKEINNRTDHKKYNNLLIFICGNIDSAYSMSSDVSEVDTDADILHERSKKITVLDIKQELLGKFKPEQIARLGNNHIIYPSLSKKHYQELISIGLKNITEKFLKVSNVDIKFTNKINEIVYRNGVFPTQGTRPLFSTLNNIVENSLPQFLMEAIKSNNKEITLDFNNGEILCFGKELIGVKKIDLDIDKIKEEISQDTLAMIAVHETGHALAYTLLFKTCPIEICSDAVSYSSGFVVPHQIELTPTKIRYMIQVALAGRIAEEMIFGKENCGVGAESDIRKATYWASVYVRNHCMGTLTGKYLPYTQTGSVETLTNITKSEEEVEEILLEERTKITQMLNNNKQLFKKLVGEVLSKKKLKSEDIYSILKSDIPDIKLLDLKESIQVDYYKKLSDFMV